MCGAYSWQSQQCYKIYGDDPSAYGCQAQHCYKIYGDDPGALQSQHSYKIYGDDLVPTVASHSTPTRSMETTSVLSSQGVSATPPSVVKVRRFLPIKHAAWRLHTQDTHTLYNNVT